jgi:hypothetical protein
MLHDDTCQRNPYAHRISRVRVGVPTGAIIDGISEANENALVYLRLTCDTHEHLMVFTCESSGVPLCQILCGEQTSSAR